jgi:hypothetical protein
MADRIVGESNVDLEDEPDQPPEEKTGILPDIIRKALLTGVGALFMTEEGIRNAAGQLKLPKDALNYLVSQADKTRVEVVRVVSQEVRRFLESETLRREVWKVLTGVTLEVNASIQLKPSGEPGMKVSVKRKKDKPEGDSPSRDDDHEDNASRSETERK